MVCAGPCTARGKHPHARALTRVWGDASARSHHKRRGAHERDVGALAPRRGGGGGDERVEAGLRQRALGERKRHGGGAAGVRRGGAGGHRRAAAHRRAQRDSQVCPDRQVKGGERPGSVGEGQLARSNHQRRRQRRHAGAEEQQQRRGVRRGTAHGCGAAAYESALFESSGGLVRFDAPTLRISRRAARRSTAYGAAPAAQQAPGACAAV